MSVTHYLVGVDMGSTGIKAVALQDGRIAATAHARMTYLEEDDNCEYDAKVYYQTVSDLIHKLVDALPGDAVCDGVTAVCASGNVLLLKEDEPLLPIISWRDSRGGGDIDTVFGPITEDQVHRSVGWHKAPKFPLAQFSWLKINHPELLEAADRICEGSCYIHYRLSGEWAMDYSTATTFYLQDQVRLCWNQGTLKAIGISEDKLPKLMAVGGRIGSITPTAALETGLPVNTPVLAGCYDGASAARCVGILREDQMLTSCGTSWVCIYPSTSRKRLLDLGMMIDPYLTEKGLWAGMTSLGEAGVYVDRALDSVLPRNASRAEEFSRLAAASVPGAHGLLIDPMRLEQCGDLSAHSNEDVCRAIMEGIVYSVKKQMNMIQTKQSRLHVNRIYMVGGPSNSRIWPQIFSDVMNCPVQVAHSSNACAVGAAMIAGIGAGIYTNLEDALSKISGSVRFYQPSTEAAAVYQAGFAAFQKAFPGPEENMH